MKIGRWIGVMVLLACVALVAVQLRSEQSRCAARILQSEVRRMALRSELWELQMAVARLRGPAEVHERLSRFATASSNDVITAPSASPRSTRRRRAHGRRGRAGRHGTDRPTAEVRVSRQSEILRSSDAMKLCRPGYGIH